MNQFLDKHRPEYQNAVSHYKQDIASLKTGRASPSMVENIQVEAYGSRMPIQQLASITVPEPKMIVIQPWDKSVLKDIERGISAAKVGMNPVNEGAVIRIVVPPLTEENRKELVKLLKQKTETAKQQARNIRDEIRKEIAEAEKAKTVSEDEKFRYFKEVDEQTKKTTDELEKISSDKSVEIMSI